MPGDAFFADVELLLHLNGADGSSSFVDSSSLARTVTRTSGTSGISTAQSKFGGASLRLDGSTRISAGSGFDFSGQFTIELWFWYDTNGLDFETLFGLDGGGSGAHFYCVKRSGGGVLVQLGSGSVTATTGFVQAAWNCLAITRDASGLVNIFCNGVLNGSSFNSSYSPASSRVISFGGEPSIANNLLGYIDEVRVTTGVARYSGNYTPETAEFPNSGDTPSGTAAITLEVDTAGTGSHGVRGDAAVVLDPVIADGSASHDIFLATAAVELAALEVVGVASHGVAGAGEVALPALVVGGVGTYSSPPVDLRLVAASVLDGARAGPIVFEDFTTVLGEPTSQYVMDVLDDGGVATRIPISSWQATLRDQAGSDYAQCVIPAAQPWLTALQNAVEFVVFRVASLPSGGGLEYEMVRCPLEQLSLDQGAFRYTATISGYIDAATGMPSTTATERDLQDVRMISTSEGGVRLRSSIDWLLRPGRTAHYQDLAVDVTFINYYVNGEDQYMDVGSYQA